MKTKNEIRKELKAAIGELSTEEKQQQSTHLCERLLSDPGILSAKTLGIYLPLADEPDLRPALTTLMQRGLQIALPFPGKSDTGIPAGDLPWHFHWITDLRSTQTGLWKLDFPEAGEQVNASALEVILVPGRGFTTQGQRIGRGKGYYDRLLQDHQGQRIGIGFSCQLRDTLPVEPHDILLSEVWT